MMFRVEWSSPLRLALLALMLVLTACATRPITDDAEQAPKPPRMEERVEQEEPTVEAPPTSDLALNQLLMEARRNLAAEKWQAATVNAERGLRIDRREPELYLVLAKAYVGLSEPQRALEFVRQGLRYASNERSPVTVDLRRLQAMLQGN